MSQLEEIKAQAEGHTEGPWVIDGFADGDHVRLAVFAGTNQGTVIAADIQNGGDAELFAAAPKLIAALEAVEALHVREVLAVHEGYGVEAWCPPCREHWPCPTVAAIAEALR